MSDINTQVTVSASQAAVLQDGLIKALEKRYTKFYAEFQAAWIADCTDYIESALKRRFFGLLAGKQHTYAELDKAFLPESMWVIQPDEFGPKWWGAASAGSGIRTRSH